MDFYDEIIKEFKKLKVDAAIVEQAIQPQVLINKEDLKTVCEFLFSSEKYYFDFLTCVTAIDNADGTLDILYHLNSIPFQKAIILKVSISNAIGTEIETVSDIWKTANWHEREIFDLFGIKFTNHPDLRRILMPADWEGHPLRKDYTEQTHYHGIKVKY